jgi:SpoVK/Ycf46/Vps4 family AAA+-type ATPase
MFAQALTKETDGIFIKVDPDDVFDPYFGNSEKKMRAVLNIASRESEKANKPTILFFDEIDGLLGEPGPNDCEAKTCLLKVFQTWMDGLEERTSTVIVVGATNFPDKLQEAILSRFGKQIHVGLPSVDDIVQIIKNDLQFRKQQCNLTVSEYKSLAQTIHHQEASGRDVTTLCKNTYDTIVIMAIKAKFWCKSNGKLYTPCNHGRGKGCGRKCSGEVPDNCRELHPWSLADFEAAIDKFGISMSKKKAFKY